MRLIDAEALETKIQKIKAEALEHGFAPESVCGDILLNFLDNAPIIEAKPIVHAHWEEIANGFMVCSHCEESVEENRKYSYCPICGAQMDESISCGHEDDNHIAEDGKKGVKIPVISMEDVPKLAKEMEK